jgi:hypothetical protein
MAPKVVTASRFTLKQAPISPGFFDFPPERNNSTESNQR